MTTSYTPPRALMHDIQRTCGMIVLLLLQKEPRVLKPKIVRDCTACPVFAKVMEMFARVLKR